MPYYIVKHGDKFEPENQQAYNNFGAAQQYATESNRKNGNHYRVMEVKSVWTTQTLADLKAEGHF